MIACQISMRANTENKVNSRERLGEVEANVSPSGGNQRSFYAIGYIPNVPFVLPSYANTAYTFSFIPLLLRIFSRFSTSTDYSFCVFVFRCVQNCQRHVILSSRLILETRCTGLLCNEIDVYTWSMKYRDIADQTWKEVTNLDEIRRTYRNSPNLVTRQGTLLGNASYLVTVTGKVASKGHSSTTTYSFVTNTPPTGGTCGVDKPEGKAWETTFVFTCNDWHDEDLPLQFQFRYNSSDGIEMVLQSGTLSTAAVTLPVGDPKEDYKLQVQVLINDRLGSSVETWINVKVSIHAVVLNCFSQIMILFVHRYEDNNFKLFL